MGQPAFVCMACGATGTTLRSIAGKKARGKKKNRIVLRGGAILLVQDVTKTRNFEDVSQRGTILLKQKRYQFGRDPF